MPPSKTLAKIADETAKSHSQYNGILPDSEVQQDLFSKNQYTTIEQNLIQKIDEINTKTGSETTHFASTGIEKSWPMKQEHLSPKYTTSWDKIVEIKAP